MKEINQVLPSVIERKAGISQEAALEILVRWYGFERSAASKLILYPQLVETSWGHGLYSSIVASNLAFDGILIVGAMLLTVGTFDFSNHPLAGKVFVGGIVGTSILATVFGAQMNRSFFKQGHMKPLYSDVESAKDVSRMERLRKYHRDPLKALLSACRKDS